MREATLMGATALTGLSAGLYYGFSCAVMPGLRRAGDRTFVETMRRINTAILNGWFLLLFLGSLVLILLAGGLHLAGDGGGGALPWIGGGAAAYAAVLAVTFRANIPLNDALDAAPVPLEGPADPAALAAARQAFERTWTRWNTVRTVLNTAAFGCLVRALLG